MTVGKEVILNFIVVTTDELPDEMVSALEAMHARIATSYLKWAKNFEGSYIPQNALRCYDPAHAFYPSIRVDGSFGMDQHGSDWIIQRHIIREQGIVLAGPVPQNLIGPVHPNDLRRAAQGILYEWWSQETMGERWTALIERAIMWQHGMQLDNLNETLDFIRYTRESSQQFKLGKAKKLHAIKKSKNKESRWMQDQNHKISRQIVNHALINGVGVIRMEDLTDIRNTAKSEKKVRRNLHSWAFYQLKEMIRYKAEMVGIRFEEVKAQYTSQICKCGHREKANRKGLQSKCRQCGYTCHADLNGAINISKAISGLVA